MELKFLVLMVAGECAGSVWKARKLGREGQLGGISVLSIPLSPAWTMLVPSYTLQTCTPDNGCCFPVSYFPNLFIFSQMYMLQSCVFTCTEDVHSFYAVCFICILLFWTWMMWWTTLGHWIASLNVVESQAVHIMDSCDHLQKGNMFSWVEKETLFCSPACHATSFCSITVHRQLCTLLPLACFK